jgi:hypothetical protein
VRDGHEKPFMPPHDRAAERILDEQRRRFGAALARLGCTVHKWRGDLATIERGGERFHASIGTILPSLPSAMELLRDDQLTLHVADALGLPVDASLLEDLRIVRPLLRPRLVNVRELEGPARGMCRRSAWADLLWAVSVGRGTRRVFVTSPVLDTWGLEFDEVMDLAQGNLAAALDSTHIHDVEGATGVLALVHDREPASAAVAIIDTIVPDMTDGQGALFGAPADEVLLMYPVEEGAGASGLAGMVQATFALMGERTECLSEHLVWRRGERWDALPMTWVEEGGSRRVHVEAEGVMRDLLRVLGEVD